MKKRLLVTEFWGLGDLAIASEFLQNAIKDFDVLLVAKPYAVDLGKELWPKVQVVPFVAPWTSFRGKYQLHKWPWPELKSMLHRVRGFQPDIAISGRWDPRDHLILALSGATKRVGFPRKGSGLLLTQSLSRVPEDAPRTAQWKALQKALQITPSVPPPRPLVDESKSLVIHTGAAQAVRVWPLDRYARLADHLTRRGWSITVLCDQDQKSSWLNYGVSPIVPSNPTELICGLKTGSFFIGNDSGPGHLAAALGRPTFTIFGPQRPEWFLPNHPSAAWIEGKPCPHKPCFDYCQFPRPNCILDLTYEEVMAKVDQWLEGHD